MKTCVIIDCALHLTRREIRKRSRRASSIRLLFTILLFRAHSYSIRKCRYSMVQKWKTSWLLSNKDLTDQSFIIRSYRCPTTRLPCKVGGAEIEIRQRNPSPQEIKVPKSGLDIASASLAFKIFFPFTHRYILKFLDDRIKLYWRLTPVFLITLLFRFDRSFIL